MKQKCRFLSCFLAVSLALGMSPFEGLLRTSDIITTVDAASPGDKLSVGGGTSQHKGTSDGYSYEIWIDRTGGNGTMTLGQGATFKAEWSANVSAGNFLARRGLDFGSKKKATDYEYIGLDYEAEYRQTGSANGNSRLCVYGWFQNKGAAGNVPLVEYYIIEDWVDWCPDAPGKMVTIDGAQYKIFQMDHTGPSINSGSETFKQYFSVRQDKRTSGHITVSDHFKAWADQGWGIGNLYEVALNAEGWQSSGVADIKKLDVYTTPTPGTTTPPTTTTAPQQPSIQGTPPSGSGTGISDGFEGSGTTWTARGDEVKLLLTSDLKSGGSKSLAVTGRTASWNGVSASSSELKAGESYSFSSQVTYKNSNYASSGFEFGVQYDLNGETNYDNIGSATTSSGKWADLSGDFKIPSGAENISLYIQSAYTESDTAADMIDFYVDDVKLSSSTGNPTTTTTTTTTGTPVSTADSLKGKFASCFKMGTSVSPNELNSGADFIKKHFNSITPENELKPDAIIDQSASQSKGNNVDTQVNLSRAAQTLKFCEQNGIGVRGHTFIWHSQTPDWFFRENFSNNGAYVSKEVMNKRIESFIKNTFEAIETQYPKLNLYAYDVCNELFLNDGGGMRGVNATSNSAASNWARIYGENNDEFVYTAFRAARKYAPEGCKLYINDYNEYIPAKTDDIYNLVMGLKKEGLIDGIGMQSHLDVSYPSAQVYKTALEKFLSTGLEVSITELDITTNGDYSAQADLFKAIFEMAVENRTQIPSFTVWGTHDPISWRSSQNPLLFSSGYKEKEAYKAVMSIKVPTDDAPTVTTSPDVTTTPTTTTPKVTTVTSNNSGNVTVAGDIDENGTVSSTDLVKLMQSLVGKVTLSSSAKKNADINNDGKVSIVDLIKLKNMLI
ncbi:MAG: endo-1,4-beta-xylanase [Oscillospiraceae bacterium]|nr:endo-1,4-beta-xylanase [Oscillospiraceae bacterium]